MNVKLYDAPGANGPELKAPPVAVHVCVTVSLFVTVTVAPTGTDMLDGLNAKLAIVIASCTGGTVVVVGGGGGGGWVVAGSWGGGWVAAGGGWFAAADVAPLVCVPADGGAVVEVLVAAPAGGAGPLFGAPCALSVVGVRTFFWAALVVVVTPLAGRERPDCDVVVDRFALLSAAGAPPQAAVSVTSASPTSTSETRVRVDDRIFVGSFRPGLTDSDAEGFTLEFRRFGGVGHPGAERHCPCFAGRPRNGARA